MSKKRGFTLVEVLVVVAITSLVFALVGGTFVFLATSSGDLIDKSEELILTQTIEKHLRSLTNNSASIKISEYSLDKNGIITQCKINAITVKFENNTLTIDETQYEDIDSFYFYLVLAEGNQYFFKCHISFGNDGGTYEFILGIYTQQ